MEISSFLQQSATWNLRKTYLNSVRQKHTGILELLKLLLNPNAPDAEKKNTLSTLFNEVHRLKGSGGTYGFNEISWIYKELIAFIRPANEGKRTLDFLDAQKALETANEFSRYLPLFFSAFESTNPSPTLPASSFPGGILLVSEERPPFVAVLERFFVQKPRAFFTTPSRAEALEALKIMEPRWLIVNADFPDGQGLDISHELKQNERAQNASLALLLKNTVDKERKDILSAGADRLFSLDTPAGTLLEEIESWIVKS